MCYWYFSKYAWVLPLKDWKVITITKSFQTLDKPSRKPNKIWVDKGSESYNRSMKSWLQDNDIEMYQHIMKQDLLLLIVSVEP